MRSGLLEMILPKVQDPTGLRFFRVWGGFCAVRNLKSSRKNLKKQREAP